MSQCRNISHPFQNDPGTSQRQRLMPQLFIDAPKIDGRKMADLLDYFAKLATHINFYDKDLAISDWQPFFNKSIPFKLSYISKYNAQVIAGKFDLYLSIFKKRPGKDTLQLLVHYMYYSTIYQINNWHLTVKDSGLPFESLLQKLVLDRLIEPAKNFISLANASSRENCIRNIDFSAIKANNIWNLDAADLLRTDNSSRPRRGRRVRMAGLVKELEALWPAFNEAVRLLSSVASDSIEESLYNQKPESKQLHAPHLALVFSFLKLFQHLQSDLNGFTRRHLDFFYKSVLRLVPKNASPDSAHLVFEIQKQLDNYLLKKGLLVKDAKDKNNTEIQFALDDEIVVNRAQVEEVKTLYLQKEPAIDNKDIDLIQGIYIAPDAGKADGLLQDFTDGSGKNWPTLGASVSKFTSPGSSKPEWYPQARIGFVLASPVLLLNEGLRKINIQIYCKHNSKCSLPAGFSAITQFMPALQNAMGETFVIISKKLVAEAVKNGISTATIDKLNQLLPVIPREACCPGESPDRQDRIQLTKDDWDNEILNTAPLNEKESLMELFPYRRLLNMAFSGEKKWISPGQINLLSIEPKGMDYLIRMNVTIDAEQPGIVFYNKDVLKEDFETTLPLVKIELDTEIRITYPGMQGSEPENEFCCFENCPPSGIQYISLYQFFRELSVEAGTAPDETQIEVEVCGLKDIVLQNDENVMDPNGTVYPFGPRPKVPDFELINPPVIATPNPNLTGPDFYIGSKEVFGKKWSDVRVNINWKDKPSNFKDYYRAYYTNPADPNNDYGLVQDNFKMNLAFLRNGQWIAEAANRKLFDVMPSTPLCANSSAFDQTIGISYDPVLLNTPFFSIDDAPFEKLEGNTRNGFIRINLRDQDFLHKDYAFVLARQMMAFGRFPDALIEGAVYVDEGNSVIVFRSLGKAIVELKDEINNSKTAAETARNIAAALRAVYNNAISWPPPLSSITNAERDNITPGVHQVENDTQATFTQASLTKVKLDTLQALIDFFDPITGEIVKKLRVLIPNEPWAPLIKNISLDYKASAKIADMDLIHLYPYENTHKKEEITLRPMLFPTYCEEGTLFIGLKQLEPGSNLNILFQLAEATANSEAGKAEIQWDFLSNNQWLPLRNGFEVLNDATSGLTTSGVIKFSIPGNINKENTLLSHSLHWIRASAISNVIAVSETIGIHTQAVKATFLNTPAHDQLRLMESITANKLSKLAVADASIKKIAQPYDSFDGAIPEEEGNFYIRVSEWLRHKGRGIQKFDYERLVLNAFPQIFKVKCINHNFWLKATRYRVDVNAAPGYVMIAVIPDLNKLGAGSSLEPKVPVSLLEKITNYLVQRTSPFARIKVVNPRYEKIDMCIRVKLIKGKDKVFYESQLENDLRLFLAPWAIGEYDKLNFGQCINRSDVVRFIEARDYVDYIVCFRMTFERYCDEEKTVEVNEVCPLTPRSILVGGNIDVCIAEDECEKWQDGRDDCSRVFDVTTVLCSKVDPGPVG